MLRIDRKNMSKLSVYGAMSFAMVACGGGGGGNNTPPIPPPTGVLEFVASTYAVDETVLTTAIEVKRTGGSRGFVGVDIEADPASTAVSGDDFNGLPFTVTFNDGDTTNQTVVLEINNDTDDEPDETVILSMARVTGGASIGSQRSTTVTIVDDDPALSALGGNSAGLSGSGLVLRLNGSVDVAVDVDGDFILAPDFLEGSAYDVQVATRPWSPAQDCTITNGTGIMGAVDIVNITVTCTDTTLQSLLLRRTTAGPTTEHADLVIVREDGADLTTLAESPGKDRYKAINDGRLIYETEVSPSDFELSSVLLDGTGPVRLASSANRGLYGGVTGAGIIIHQQNGNLFASGADGSNLTQLTYSGDADTVAVVTIDGRVVFERLALSSTNGFHDIYAVDFNGDNLTVLADTTDDEIAHAVTPQGRVIYSRFDNVLTDIFSVGQDGVDPKVLAADSTADYLFKTLLPNERVVYSGVDASGEIDLFSVRADASGVVNLTQSSLDVYYATCTRDGRVIYFVDRAGQADLNVVFGDGSGASVLSATPGDDQLVGVTSDNRAIIAYTDSVTWYLENISLDGNDVQRTADNIDFGNTVIAAGNQIDRIVFGSDADGQYDLFSVRPDGTDRRRLTNSLTQELIVDVTSTGGVIYYSYDGSGLRRIGVDGNGEVHYTDGTAGLELVRIIDPDTAQGVELPASICH